MEHDDLANLVAGSVISTFNSLPNKAKPRVYSDVSREWVPLSGFVLCKQNGTEPQCVALGTGMRCLPQSKISLARGVCLHDWHAEVVAMRALNLFLLGECEKLCSNSLAMSDFMRRRTAEEISVSNFQQFALKEDLRICMYCSEAPCGDASMELTIASQADSDPWHRREDSSDFHNSLHGRGFFSELGIVRRKPARADAPPTMSKSCSDKLALKQCTSMLSSVASTIVAPSSVYLHDLVLPAERCIDEALRRSFHPSGRMSSLQGKDQSLKEWSGGYSFRPFRVRKTTRAFEFSRAQCAADAKGTNITAMWTPNLQEVLIGGTIQGYKQFDARGKSAICRASVWRRAFDIANQLEDPVTAAALNQRCYGSIKGCEALLPRNMVKADVLSDALKGWVRNSGDAYFVL